MSLIKELNKGKYITFEGVDGVGKTYLISKLPKGFVIIKDSDLRGVYAEIFNLLRKSRKKSIISDFLIYAAIDLHEIEEKVLPNLVKNKIVVKDRGVDTNCLYAAIELCAKNKKSLIENFRNLLKIREEISPLPDKTIVFTDDFKEIIKRLEKRDKRKYSKKELSFLKKVYFGFEELAKEFPKRIIKIDRRNKTEKEIIEKIIKILKKFM